jgi:hypothetical protein
MEPSYAMVAGDDTIAAAHVAIVQQANLVFSTDAIVGRPVHTPP